ncbi:MAG: hypothetical protein K0R24_124 [Gammaproteobacteria bacterium]|jgi:hypothetical protein|nr:hypothetical protein [Gammaproteobacteria bacterium]MCE3237143.1 hypothetical protein [Gammaproteobacteria bacterium]
MKTITNLVGIFLIIMGIGVLAYKGISYTKQEKVAQIGSVQVTADKEKTVYFSPLLGGLSLVAGITLLLIVRRNGK